MTEKACGTRGNIFCGKKNETKKMGTISSGQTENVMIESKSEGARDAPVLSSKLIDVLLWI